MPCGRFFFSYKLHAHHSTFLFLIFSEENEESEEEGEDPSLDSLSQAIAFQVRMHRYKTDICFSQVLLYDLQIHIRFATYIQTRAVR